MDNKEDIFYKVIEKAKEVTLTDKERQALFLAVDTFVAKNPLPATMESATGAMPQAEPTKAGFISVKPVQSFLSFWDLYGMRTGVALLALVVLSGGTSLAAQKALPGDFLYSVRVNVNEGVKGVFLSDAERSEYQLERVKNRIDEAKALAAEDKLSDDAQKSLLSKLSGHLSVVQKNLNNIASRGDLKTVFQMSQTVEEAIGENEAVLSGLAKHSVADDVKLVSIKDALEESRQASMLARNQLEEQILARNVDDNDTRVLAEAKSNSAKKTLESLEKRMQFDQNEFIVEEDLARNAPLAKGVSQQNAVMMSATLDARSASASSSDDHTSARIKEAKELLQKGEDKLKEGKYKEAFALFKKSYEISKDLQTDIQLENANIQNELDSTILDLESGE